MTINRIQALICVVVLIGLGLWLGFVLDNEETTTWNPDGHQGEVYVVDLEAWCPENDHVCHATGYPEAEPAEPVPMTTESEEGQHDHSH